MIQWVYERAQRARLLDEVVVATDDARIQKAVRDFGGKAIMTSPRHVSGTDRVAEAARKTKAAVIVNIQGDEPLVEPGAIDRAVRALRQEKTCQKSTLAAPLRPENIPNPNVLKVVMDRRGNALYFSRAPIPYPVPRFQHIGLYVYRRDVLLGLSQMRRSRLEVMEKLEQLRALENGLEIKVVKIKAGWPSVDRPEDVNEVEQRMKGKSHARG